MDRAHCSRCSVGFHCGATGASCWCSLTNLSDETRGRLAIRYEGCLCPACLGELADAEPDDH